MAPEMWIIGQKNVNRTQNHKNHDLFLEKQFLGIITYMKEALTSYSVKTVSCS